MPSVVSYSAFRQARTAADARTAIGLGSSSTLDVGTSANNIVQLDGTSKLPAVDGSQLTNLSGVNPFDQDLNTTDTPSFTGATIAQDRSGGSLIAEQLGSAKTDNIEIKNAAASTSWLIGVGVPGQYDGYLVFRKPGGSQISSVFIDDSNRLGCGQDIMTGNRFGAYGGQTTRHYDPNNNTITWNGDTFTWDAYYVDGTLQFAGDAIIFKALAGGEIRVGIDVGISPTVALDVNGTGRFRGDLSADDTINLSASTTARASMNLPSGTAPTSPNNGDIWSDGSDVLVRLGGTTYTLTKT